MQVLEMARRLVLVGVMVLVSRGSVTQLVIATVLSAVYLLLQMQASPFEDLGGTNCISAARSVDLSAMLTWRPRCRLAAAQMTF
jgi:hypothetical protein